MNSSKIRQPIYQVPTDLVFAITTYDVSNLLTVFKTKTFCKGDYEFEFAIIGESHCITIFHQGRFVLQEVLACTNIPAIVQADSHKFAKLEPYLHTKQDYQARVWFRDSLQNDPIESHGEMKLDFPEVYGQIPFTHVQWIMLESSICWRTTHVYPLEPSTKYVYTESCFALNERSTDE